MKLTSSQRFTIRVLILVMTMGSIAKADMHGQDLVVTGRVVGYLNSPMRITRLTDVPKEEVLFVNVVRVVKGKTALQYIKVRYLYLEEKTGLPDELFTGKDIWKLGLKRNTRCDRVEAGLKMIRIGTVARNFEHEKVPCYDLVKFARLD